MALGHSRALLARTNQADRISWDIVINADDDKNDAYRARLYIYHMAMYGHTIYGEIESLIFRN